MASIVSIGLCVPPYRLPQEQIVQFARDLFADSFREINRLLKVFDNGQVKERYFSAPLEWYKSDHSFAEKNELFIEKAIEYGTKAIKDCLTNPCLKGPAININEIEAIFYISSTGIATPSIEARIMNELPFSKHCKRIPIWGLGCAGGASGLARAFEYCTAFPKAKVLVLSIELCSLTFQKNDHSKSNLVGTSLFADGVACALVCGNEAWQGQSLGSHMSTITNNADREKISDEIKEDKPLYPKIKAVQTTLMPNSEDIMGWDIRDEGLYVIFSKDIPTVIHSWLKDNVTEFLHTQQLTMNDIKHFIAHPGGKKVLDAYQEALLLEHKHIQLSLEILMNYGNMSSATIFFVLKKHMESVYKKGDIGLLVALGPGFSSELLLLCWE